MTRQPPDPLDSYRLRGRVLQGQLAAAEARIRDLHAQRKALMQELRAQGVALDEIGRILGVSRQTVWEKLKDASPPVPV